MDDNLIRNNHIQFDMKCNRAWYKGNDLSLFSNIHSNYENSLNDLANKFHSICSENEMIYVESTKNVPYSRFIVEFWGRE